MRQSFLKTALACRKLVILLSLLLFYYFYILAIRKLAAYHQFAVPGICPYISVSLDQWGGSRSIIVATCTSYPTLPASLALCSVYLLVLDNCKFVMHPKSS